MRVVPSISRQAQTSGIPPGFELLSEDLQDFHEKSRNRKSGHLSKFSLTATQAILYFDSFAAEDAVTVKFRLRAKYPIRARTFKSRVYEYYNPEVAAIARPVQLEVVSRSGDGLWRSSRRDGASEDAPSLNGLRPISHPSPTYALR
jgi:hypothetical protein